jgi:hypothetical protein
MLLTALHCLCTGVADVFMYKNRNLRNTVTFKQLLKTKISSVKT